MSRDMQFAQLRAFAAVARLRSYTRAAEELSYTEPAVYLQVRGLEKALGVPLIRRTGGRLILTREGEELLPLVHDLLGRAAQLTDAAHGLRRDARLVVGAGRYTGVYLLIPVLATYLAQSEHYEPELQLADRDGLIDGVIDGTLDFAVAGTLEDYLTPELRRRHGLVLVPWREDEWALVGPPALDAASLAALPQPVQIYLPAYGSSARSRLQAILMDGFSTPPRLTLLPTADAVRSAVLNGLGLALFPLLALQGAAKGGDLRVLRRFGAVGRLRVSILHRRARLLTPPARHFLRFIVASRRAPAATPAPALTPAEAPS